MSHGRGERLPSDADKFSPAPRRVKPRHRAVKRMPVIALCLDTFITEDGEIGTVDELVKQLPMMPPTVFAKQCAADFLSLLDMYFDPFPRSNPAKHTPSWQWRASSNERELVHLTGVRMATRLTTAVHYFGWKNGSYHKLIDPVVMYGHHLDDMWPGDDPTIVKVRDWAIAIRNFCFENNVEIRPTSGGIMAQFLTDPRFYPNARRKVPRSINERVREQLPGNHYHLTVTPTPDREFTAYYLDQRRAHHYHARNTTLPNANQLYAYGNFVNLDEPAFDQVADDFYGLYCLDLETDTDPVFSWLRYVQPNSYSDKLARRFEKLFVYSNELPHLLDSGYRVTGVRAAWGSRFPDTGIARYSTWAEEQLDRYSDPPWLKSLLLTTYGVLATRPRDIAAIFKLAKSGEPVQVFTGLRSLTGLKTAVGKKMDPNIANVLHRGMIEAGTRSDSVGLAQWLDSMGHTILSIYADAVMVEVDDDNPLPQLPDPWRLKETLNHLQFINQQAFMSGEMTKLPGVSQEIRKYRQRSPGVAPRHKKYSIMGV